MFSEQLFGVLLETVSQQRIIYLLSIQVRLEAIVEAPKSFDLCPTAQGVSCSRAVCSMNRASTECYHEPAARRFDFRKVREFHRARAVQHSARYETAYGLRSTNRLFKSSTSWEFSSLSIFCRRLKVSAPLQAIKPQILGL